MYNDNYSVKNHNLFGKSYIDYNRHLIQNKRRLELSFKSSIDEINFHNFDQIISVLKELSEDHSIQVDYIDQSSSNFILNGSDQGLKQLETLFTSGELQELLNKIKSEDFFEVIIENICFVEDEKIIKKCQL
ncbi:MAG: hypothetical protein AB4062_11880, partial [Crocosphaera sp.]